MINKLEALLDALASLKGFNNPDSLCYQIRNPLMVKSFARPGKHEVTEDGLRVFDSTLAGYKAGLFDLEKKVSGTSRAGVKADDTLQNVFRVYGITELGGMDAACKYLKRALKDQAITKNTPLSYFQ